jgi:hypothetical protein
MDVERGSALHRDRPHPAWVAEQEYLLHSGPVGDAHQVDLGVVQIGQDLVDIVGVHRRGVVPQVAVQVGQAGLNAGAQRGLAAARSGERRAGQRVRAAGATLLDEHQVPVDVEIQQIRQLTGNLSHG